MIPRTILDAELCVLRAMEVVRVLDEVGGTAANDLVEDDHDPVGLAWGALAIVSVVAGDEAAERLRTIDRTLTCLVEAGAP